jgi:hypothetical protein
LHEGIDVHYAVLEEMPVSDDQVSIVTQLAAIPEEEIWLAKHKSKNLVN